MEAEQILNILSWIGSVSGVVLIFLLLISAVFGADWDLDLDIGGDTDFDADTGGLGIVKGVLTFVSVTSLTVRAIMLNSDWSWAIAIATAVIAGAVAFLILSKLFDVLLKQQEDGSWQLNDAVGLDGEVYISIPENGIGKISILINGALREIDAKSQKNEEIPTATKIYVLEAEEDILIVSPL